MWMKRSESHDRPRHVLDVIEWRWRKAQAVTECAGKEALSGPREAFTGHSSANPSPGLSQGFARTRLFES